MHAHHSLMQGLWQLSWHPDPLQSMIIDISFPQPDPIWIGESTGLLNKPILDSKLIRAEPTANLNVKSAKNMFLTF